MDSNKGSSDVKVLSWSVYRPPCSWANEQLTVTDTWSYIQENSLEEGQSPDVMQITRLVPLKKVIFQLSGYIPREPNIRSCMTFVFLTFVSPYILFHIYVISCGILIWNDVLRLILIKYNKMQQYAGIYLLQNHSTCFGCPSHPSSGERKTVNAVSGTGHSIWATAFLQRGLIRPLWRKVVAQILWPVPEAAVTVLCSPDNECDGHPKHVESDFAVNNTCMPLHLVGSY